MSACPHVKVGLWLDELIRIYRSRSAERSKNGIFICLKCGHKNTKSMLEQHAKQHHAHKIIIHLKTMETLCFSCKKTPTDNTGYLNNVISKLNELPYFYKKVTPNAVSKQTTTGFNATSKPTLSRVEKPNAPAKSITAIGKKSCKNASSVTRSSKGYGTSVVRTQQQCQDHKYQHRKQSTCISSSKADKNKTIAKKSTVHKSPLTRHSNTFKASKMETDYNLRGTANKQRREYHPLLSSIDGTGLNTMQNHLIVRSSLMKDDKEKEKSSKNSGRISKGIAQTKNLPTHKWRDKISINDDNNYWKTIPQSVPQTTILPKHQDKNGSREPSFNDTNSMLVEYKTGHISKGIAQTKNLPTHKWRNKTSINDDNNYWKTIPQSVPKATTILPKHQDKSGSHQPSFNDTNAVDKQEELFPVVSHGEILPEYKPIVGLKNIGNTCFFNSVLQVIYQSRYLHYFISGAVKYPLKHELDGPEGLVEFKITKPPGQLTSALNRFLNETCAGNSGQVRNPALLLNTLATRYKRFKGFDQQDSHEAFRCLLDGLRMEEIKRLQESVSSKFIGNSLKTLTRKFRTFVDETFGGVLSSTVICRDCFTPTQLTEPFFDLSLSISGLRNRRHGNSEVEDPHRICHFLRSKKLYHQLKEYKENTNFDTLEACLKCYTTLEVLDDDNKFICNTCTNDKANNSLTSPSRSSLDNLALCPVSKLLLLHELPKVLVLHLKRFKLGATVTKNNRHIDFPFELDVAPYCTNHCKKLMKNDKIMYSLYGVVVHHGSLHGGHYTAYVKAATIHDITMWYYASDSHVRSARVEEIKKSNAYMLFYESVLPTD